jgi:hypothetical protein
LHFKNKVSIFRNLKQSNMKKIIIGSLVGAILLFGWQTLSWTAMGLHEPALKHTPAQDAIMSTLNSSLTEEGQYYMPRLPESASHEELEEYMKKNDGKPWALVIYHNTKKPDMPMAIGIGFLICFVCVWLCCRVISRMADRSFFEVFLTTLTFGLVCFLFVWYMGHNWMQTSWSVLKGELIDDLAGWGLTGIWLGWWYNRK